MPPYAWVAIRLWDPERLGEVVEMWSQAHETHTEGGVVVHEILARLDRVDELRRALADFPVPVEEEEYWSTLADWAREAEAAAVAGDEPLARRAIEILTPYRGRFAISGAVGITGIVDGALALAHAVVGDSDLAVELGDHAVAQAQEWGLHAYLSVFGRQRERLGF
jgi:hypothetical protein